MTTEKVEGNGEIETKKFNRTLKVLFNPHEKLAIGDLMASTIRDIKEKKDEFDSIKSRYSSDIKALEAELSGFAERLNSGWEMKPVECEGIKDFKTGSYVVRRIDTGEQIEQRALTAEELQMGLFQEKPDEEKESEPEPD
jgi:hypothetical protein